MFTPNFYPTPEAVIDRMLEGVSIEGKTVLEPSAGKGNIVDYCKRNGAASVIACENNQDLKKILQTKCTVIAEDFLTVTADQVSHIDFIIMNPPFSADEKHITHAWNICPAGCKIIALCNTATVEYDRWQSSSYKRILNTIIKENGSAIKLGDCFATAERKTDVEISLVTLQKPGTNYNSEFEGFYLNEDPAEQQANSIMPYNIVRDLVNRYIGSVKIFDEQMEIAVKMNTLLYGYFNIGKPELSMSVTRLSVPLKRNEFKKQMQKEGWNFIFSKLNMQKYATQGLKEDINKFVEQQQHIPFTMRNIYRMLDIVIATQSQRMDKALLEVFDKLTKHYDENRFNLEGWKTNSHYLINQRFIIPYMCNYSTGEKIHLGYGTNFNTIEDFLKALCYITGDNYDDFITLQHTVDWPTCIIDKATGKRARSLTYDYMDETFRDREDAKKSLWKYKGIDVEISEGQRCVYGEWFDWAYFRVRAYKKGTMHFEFKDQDLWGKMNQHIARIKGFPLFEHVKKSKMQEKKFKKEQSMFV